jgi:hypothetical protein
VHLILIVTTIAYARTAPLLYEPFICRLTVHSAKHYAVKEYIWNVEVRFSAFVSALDHVTLLLFYQLKIIIFTSKIGGRMGPRADVNVGRREKYRFHDKNAASLFMTQ